MEKIIQKIGRTMPIQPKLIRVAAYARVSNGKDAMMHSLSSQVSYYSEHIQKHQGWQYCGVYADEAKTGTKANRTNFQRLLDDCRAGKIDLVITKSISRFARNTITLLETIRELKSISVDVYFEEQNIHTMSADGELILTFLASYAQEESLSASENQKWRIKKKFEQGEMVGMRAMLGYKIDRNGMIPNKQTVPIVREIFQRVIDGDSYYAIAKDLNDRGIKCELGGEWRASHISRIITNEKDVGDALLQKKFRNNHLEKKLVKNKGELPKYYAESTHEGIIDKETFDNVQKIAVERKKKFAGKTEPCISVFSGIIKCANCGKSYRRVTSNGTVGYNCSTYVSKGKSACFGKKIPEITLQTITAETLGTKCFDESVFAEQIEKIIVPGPNQLIFCFKDGREVEKEWKDRSRSEVWTDEMRERARQKTLERLRR